MAARSIASLTLSFGLVSIPVKLYSATESSTAVKFNLFGPDGARVKQQYVSEQSGDLVERASMQKGYEFQKGQFILFSADELKALEESPSHVVEIVGFIPDKAVDPVFYDKAYFIAPDKRGGKPYSLLQQALLETHRCALAKWSFKGKTRVVQVRPTEEGLVFQQLLFADEVRSLADLHIEQVSVSEPELKLAIQIIEQGAQENYDPKQFEDEEKKRILAAIDQKIEGKQIVVPVETGVDTGAQVIDLMEALRASLSKGGSGGKPAEESAPVAKKVAAKPAAAKSTEAKPKRPVKRAEKVEEEQVPAKVRARR